MARGEKGYEESRGRGAGARLVDGLALLGHAMRFVLLVLARGVNSSLDSVGPLIRVSAVVPAIVVVCDLVVALRRARGLDC